ncbi:hypothetical protein ACWCP6_01305 [Streptomyces sp. NPDC002004]
MTDSTQTLVKNLADTFGHPIRPPTRMPPPALFLSRRPAEFVGR